MNNTPLISVIIPIYNGKDYLSKCVDSVLAQTYQNLEIILVDDGSTDTSGHQCNFYAAQDKRVQVIHQKNAGLSAARNAGINAAKGRYISLIDSDDWVAPQFIQTLYTLTAKYQAPLAVVGRYTVFAEGTRQKKMLPNGKTLEIIHTDKGNFDTRQALQMTFAPYGYFVTNKLFDRELFKQILFPVGLLYEDLWLFYRLFQYINKVVVCDTPLFYYNRLNKNSLSRGKFHVRMLDYFTVTDDFLKEAKKLKDTRLLHRLERERLAHILGFFKRMMLGGFNDWKIIKPMQQELRRNIGLLLLQPRPLAPTLFGLCCCVNFSLTSKLLIRLLGTK